MRKVWLLVVLSSLLLSGCGSESARALVWTGLTYHMTGGIAGFDRQLTLSPDGSFTVTERGKAPVKGELSSADLKRVKVSIGAVPWRELEQKYVDPIVADAIYETVAVTTSDKDFAVKVGTGGAPPPVLTELLAVLKQIGK